MRRSLALIAAALALPLPAAAVAAQPAPASRAVDWATRVETTAEGGYRMGNPDAPLKLVEYGSITCSHCATFANEANAPLRQHVRSGRVSFEYRPYLIFPSDPGLFMLLACQPSQHFFATVENLYATQEQWVARIQSKNEELAGLTSWGAVIPAVMRASGLTPVFTQHGLSQQQVDACLTDQAAFNRLVESRDRATAAGVEGTPTFYLNGRKLEVADWAGLEPLLRQP